MGKAKAPSAPDPVATASAQTGQNTLAANANTIAQSGSVTNPYGTRNSSLENVEVMNPLTGKMENILRNNVTETLAPGQQAIFDQNQGSNLNLATYGNNQTSKLMQLGADPFSYSTGAHEKWFADNYDKLNAENNAFNDEATRSRLSNSGIKLGSAAYDREMKNAMAARDTARTQALMNAQGQGFTQALQTRNQQFNEPLAIASGTQLQNPNFQQGGAGTVATTDYAGIEQQAYQNQVAKANQKNANFAGLLSGIGSAAFALSDERAKENIEPVGKLQGENIYTWNYKEGMGPPGKHMGVMAQEVAKKKPDAVVKGADGLLRVSLNKVFALGA